MRRVHPGQVTYDVIKIREHFPALAEGAAHFDGPGGSQVPDVVGEAVAATLCSAIANRGTVTAAERRAEDVVAEARLAAADLLGHRPDGIVFGRSMTQLTYDFSRALAKACPRRGRRRPWPCWCRRRSSSWAPATVARAPR